jgi:hypothetical protein
MGRKKYEIRRNVYVEWKILESAAVKSLSATAIRVLLRFLQKRKWSRIKVKGKPKIIYETGDLVFTYTEAEALGISRSQFHSVVKKLCEVGFIDIEHQGGGVARDYSRYALSTRWEKYGTDDFKPLAKRRVLQAGLDVQSHIARQKKVREPVLDKYEKPYLLRETQ